MIFFFLNKINYILLADLREMIRTFEFRMLLNSYSKLLY